MTGHSVRGGPREGRGSQDMCSSLLLPPVVQKYELPAYLYIHTHTPYTTIYTHIYTP